MAGPGAAGDTGQGGGGLRHFRENPGLGARELGHDPLMEAAIGVGGRESRGIGEQGLQQRHHQTHDRQRGRVAAGLGLGGGGG